MNKPATVEIPPTANEQVARMLIEDVIKAIKQARLLRKERLKVTIQQGE